MAYAWQRSVGSSAVTRRRGLLFVLPGVAGPGDAGFVVSAGVTARPGAGVEAGGRNASPGAAP